MAEPEDRNRAVGLLEQIADTALDDDYYVVRSGPYSHTQEFNTVLTGIVLAVFAVLVATAALQTRSDRPATERERASLISDVGARKKLLATREASVASLRGEVDRLSAAVDRFDPALEDLRVQAGDRAAVGPGVKVTTSPSILGNDDGRLTDNDLQMLVNGLWYAGAEAVSVNGNRVGTLTSIRTAGTAITVNYRSIGPPYTVIALGEASTLGQRFADNPAGRYWQSRKRNTGVEFNVAPSSDLTVPAAPISRLTLKHATAVKGAK